MTGPDWETSMRAAILPAALTGLLVLGGCNPPASYELLHHEARDAVVCDHALVVTGSISPMVAPRNYGVKLMDAHDDTGRPLTLQSFSFRYAKGLWFVLELSEPAPGAKAVSLDVAFSSGGVQRATWTLPIQRDRTSLAFPGRPGWETRQPPDRAK
jgi:hypothetical protein